MEHKKHYVEPLLWINGTYVDALIYVQTYIKRRACAPKTRGVAEQTEGKKGRRKAPVNFATDKGGVSVDRDLEYEGSNT